MPEDAANVMRSSDANNGTFRSWLCMDCMPQKPVSEFLDEVPCIEDHGADELSNVSKSHGGGDVRGDGCDTNANHGGGVVTVLHDICVEGYRGRRVP